LPAHKPFTPAGKPVTVAPVAPVVAYVIFVMAVLIHLVWESVPAPDVNDTVLLVVTEMVPVDVTTPHPPVSVTVYVNGLPAVTLGEPLITIAPPAKLPVTPVGKPANVAPVAPVVV
jgi:hypothetical protein